MTRRLHFNHFFAGLVFATFAYVPTAASHLDFVDDDIPYNQINLALTDRIKVIVKYNQNNECLLSLSLLKNRIEKIFREHGFTISDELSTPYIIQLLGLKTPKNPDGKKTCAFSIETYFKTSIAAVLPYQYELLSISPPDRSKTKAAMANYRYGGRNGLFLEVKEPFNRDIGEILLNIAASEITEIFKARDKVFADMPWLKKNYDDFWAFDPIE